MAVVSLLLVTALTLVGTASSHANGAQGNTAKDGCSCHGGASSEATVTLQAPSEYAPGGVYDLKVSVVGPMPLPSPVGQNQGGFALQVSDGKLSGGSDVRVEGEFATHTGSGNDKRSWDLKWTAPATGTEDVTFWAAANAVNGDGAAGMLDRWNKVAPIAKARPASTTNATSAPTGSPDGTPFLSAGLAVVVLVAVAWVRRS